MITGEIKNKVDKVWDAFWSGGISNPLEVIEQITYLLFIKRLDEIHTRAEKKAHRLKKPIENPVFLADSETKRGQKKASRMRWSHFKNFSPEELYAVVDKEVFPYIRALGDKDSSYSMHMADARFTIPTAALLTKVVDLIDDLPLEKRDTKGDIYEYMLGKLNTSGQNGQFRTSRHIIKMMVELIAPTPEDLICDPACGTGGFLVAASEYLLEQNKDLLHDTKLKKRYNESIFHGFDFDNVMLRIASMNLLLHGIENPDVRYKDSLSKNNPNNESKTGDESEDEEAYTVILANPPFAGSLDYENCSEKLLGTVKTKKTELLFIALFLQLLKTGGRAAVIVPDGVLFGSSKAHQSIRKMLVEDQKLDGVIAMPSGVFKPYSGVSTAVLLFTKTNVGGTDKVWFYDMQADGYSLDDKRTELNLKKHDENNIPDIIKRWKTLGQGGKSGTKEANRPRTAQSFLVPKDEIVATKTYDLSINRYKEIVYEEIDYDPPAQIIKELEGLEKDIAGGMQALKGLLK